MKLELANIEIISGLQEQGKKVIDFVANAVERGREERRAKHADQCDCPRCRDDRKWEQRCEELYGAEMRAYYAPREPGGLGVSACGLEEARNYSFAPEKRNLISINACQGFSSSLRSSLLGLKNGTLLAGTSTRGPVFGLRPNRDAR